MGYNPNCTFQNCFFNCCNFAGNCPAASSGCVYYYYNTSSHNSGGTIAGAVVGAILGVIIIVVIAVYCYRKHQTQSQIQQQALNDHSYNRSTTIIIPGNTQPQQTPYGQSQFGQPAYGQPAYGQPAYGQPAYFGNQQPYGQQQAPIIIT